MKKNGFTLIELLAVIVILAIIALIATPIILGIINDAREKSNERSVELYASAVKNGIAAYQLREGKEVKADTYNNTTNKLPFEVEYDGNVECKIVEISEDGKVSLDKCTVNGGIKEYSYGIEEESTVAKACTIERQTAGKYSIGDIVSCKTSISTEQFMVMENEDEDTTPGIDMFARYNLEVGYRGVPVEHSPGNYHREYTLIENPSGIQDVNAISFSNYNNGNYSTYATIGFASKNYWYDYNTLSSTIDSNYESEGRTAPYIYGDYDGNILYPLVQNYLTILNIEGSTGRLLSKDEADFLDDNSTFKQWLDVTGFWTGSAWTAYEAYLYPYSKGIISSFSVGAGTYEYWGLRPVITISTSEIQ